MDEGAALRATIAADPAADLPRLVYADWLEDRGDDGQAAFIRTQLQLAHEPAWSPLAVRCKHHTPEMLSGRPWRATLPAVSPRVAEWHPDTPFHRGAPDWLVVRDLASFLDGDDRLLAAAPVTRLSLPTSSLYYWQEFARRPWLRQVRALHFYSTTTPIEPLRVLGSAPNASGVESLTLERCSGPAFPVVLADLLASPLGQRLKRLDLRVGGDNAGDWVEAIEAMPATHPLDELDLTTMELGPDRMRRVARSAVFGGLRRFHVRNDGLDGSELGSVLGGRGPANALRDFTFANVAAAWSVARDIAQSPGMRLAERLDFSYTGSLYDLADWRRSRQLTSLRSLRFAGCGLHGLALSHLVSMPCWPRLTELDLRGNGDPDGSLDVLCRVEPPPEMAAVVLSGRGTGDPLRAKLQDHFRGAVVLADG